MPSNEVSDVIDIPGSVMVEKQSSETLALSKVEIDLQIATAKNYPRALAQFQKASLEMVTYSQEVADTLFYKLPRGGKIIEGPSVRFAEIIGQNWRNCRIGARVLGVDAESKSVISQGVFHDLETNVAISFEIKRRITKRDGTRYDDDMIGVTGAAAAGIAFRNAVLKGIPKMFWKPMYDKALETARGNEKDIAERRKKALAEFAKMKVPEAAILKTLGVSGISKIGADELLTLRGIYNSIREGATTPDEAFGGGPIEPTREVKKSEPVKKSTAKSANPAVPRANLQGLPKDEVISSAEQTAFYNVGMANGWKIDEIRELLKKKGIAGVAAIRRSQYEGLKKTLETGT